jgi:hypothetical protein
MGKMKELYIDAFDSGTVEQHGVAAFLDAQALDTHAVDTDDPHAAARVKHLFRLPNTDASRRMIKRLEDNLEPGWILKLEGTNMSEGRPTKLRKGISGSDYIVASLFTWEPAIGDMAKLRRVEALAASDARAMWPEPPIPELKQRISTLEGRIKDQARHIDHLTQSLALATVNDIKPSHLWGGDFCYIIQQMVWVSPNPGPSWRDIQRTATMDEMLKTFAEKKEKPEPVRVLMRQGGIWKTLCHNLDASDDG